MVVLSLVCVFTTKERVHDDNSAKKADGKKAQEGPGFWVTIKALIANKHWVMMFFANLVIFFIIIFNAVGAIYYCMYVFYDMSQYSWLANSATIAQFAIMFVTAALMKKVGKEKLYIAGMVISAIGYWVTFNEPIATYVGHAKGFFAPGLSDEKYARRCIHHLLLCHGEAVRLFRSQQLPGQIGVVVDVWKHYPARPDNAEDMASAMRNNEIEGYDMFLHPLFLGGYSEALTEYMEKNGMTPPIEPGDMETICQRLDFYGLNFYNGLYDNADEQRTAAEGGNFQNRPELHLEAVYDVLHMLVKDYGINIPIYITENGVAQDDGPDREVILNDDERIAYVSETLRHVRRAMDDGIDVRGYYLWSLMDNFEWSAGFAARFGLYYTDYENLGMIPKRSAGWYHDVIADNGFEE